MPVTLLQENHDDLYSFDDLEDGQLAVIVVADSDNPGDVGRVAQRVEDDLILIGLTYDEAYPSLKEVDSAIRLRPLEAGELIRVD
jgi:hypothetical protein